MTPPERFKADEQMTPADWLEYTQTGKRPESDEYRAARRKALEAAGLEHDDDAAPELDEMTVDDHLNRTRRTA